jgi:hypothetical protein
MAARAKKKTAKKKCRTCGGYCGRKKGQGCQYAAKEQKRLADEMWSALTGRR